MQVSFVNQSLSFRVPRSYLQKWVNFVESGLKKHKLVSKEVRQQLKGRHLILVFVDEKQSRSLNKQFRGKNKSTDVLSFAPIESEDLGELVLCVPVMRKQAKEHGLPLRQEMAYLVLHGVLHLLGYEHESSAQEAEIMFKIQDDLFAKISTQAE